MLRNDPKYGLLTRSLSRHNYLLRFQTFAAREAGVVLAGSTDWQMDLTRKDQDLSKGTYNGAHAVTNLVRQSNYHEPG